jgi:hypothetical protein
LNYITEKLRLMGERKHSEVKKKRRNDMRIWTYLFVAIAGIMLIAGMFLIIFSGTASYENRGSSLFNKYGCVALINVDGPIVAQDVQDSI